MMTSALPNWLARRALVTPNAPALIAGETLSFAALNARAEDVARRLRALGATPGSRVAALLRNGPLYAALVHAAPLAGFTLLPLNTRLSATELAWQLSDAGASLLLFDEAGRAQAEQAAHLTPGVALVAADRAGGAAPLLGDVPPSDAPLRTTIALDEVHTIIYTSGTTGRPKGAMLSYGNHWWSAVGSALNLGTRDDDRWLAPLPFFHVGGLAVLMRGAIYGMAAVIPESSDAAAINRAIDAHHVTIVSVVSTLLQRMLDERGERPFPAALRCVLLGGGPAPRPLLDACAARGIPVVQSYGLTEAASQVATLAPADALARLGSAGKPLLPNELRIIHAGEHAQPGEVGEILVRGPSIMIGYVNQPEASAAALRDGWLHTGDMGYLDAEGFLYIVDRRSDLIISGGENIYPAEVEEALLSHPDVAEAGVVGAPSAEWGQVPIAFVVARGGAMIDAAALIAHCAARLARYKIPRAIHMVDALPRNATGKLLRAQLRDRAAG
jgi:o-succinylbenzoate---CoA ligase